MSPPYVWADYLSVTRSIATPAAIWYAGTHSVDGGSNTGWSFTGPPPQATSAGVLPALLGSSAGAVLAQAASAGVLPALLGTSEGATLAQGTATATLAPLEMQILVGTMSQIPTAWLAAIPGPVQTFWSAGPVLINEEG